MKVRYIPVPRVKSHTLFAPVSDLKKNIINSNKVTFSVRYLTKTRLNVSVEAGNSSFKLNEHSKYSRDNNLTLVEKKDWNYFSGSETINHYFKLTKKQNLKEFEKHIVSLTETVLFKDLHLNELIDKENFVIEIEMTNDLLEQVYEFSY